MMHRGGIFGPSLSGKSTLAKQLSITYWQQFKMFSIVLDPTRQQWGPHAKVFTDEALFWQTVWSSKRCLVIVEESSETINRNADLIPVFTRLRHEFHVLLVVGHSGASLLPVMRQQFDTLFLFLQSKKSARDWAEDACCEDLRSATTLKQYEFLHYQRYKPVAKRILSLNKKSG